MEKLNTTGMEKSTAAHEFIEQVLSDDKLAKLEEELEIMIEARYNYTLDSHYQVVHASPIPIVGLIDLISIKSDRMKFYQNFQVRLKRLSDSLKLSKDDVKNCLLDMLGEKEQVPSYIADGTEQIIVNVLYELGMEMSRSTSKMAHNNDYALNPKKVSKIWAGELKNTKKNDDRSK